MLTSGDGPSLLGIVHVWVYMDTHVFAHRYVCTFVIHICVQLGSNCAFESTLHA